ncbi:peptide ABC transporter substrate-binding protein [Lacticaseibacillus yichunensis]|uniref:ABC transporter substrate-binding protein n=1 Tax=Lacticaseibacillus yichunensis TaxID=2486015 RepID=A0ABW4CRD7_9LACO|nr:peptide ABC transporter substrate-binding protein [Lacticaseibacillus yichunensis]
MKVKKSLKAGAMLLTLATVLAACGGNSSKATTKSASDSTWTTMVGDVISTMDPSMSTDIISGQALSNTTEGLLRYSGADLQPALATSVPEATNNGLTYTYHLRKSTWSNGTAVTAKDFVYSWQRTVDPATKSQYAYLFSGIKNADAIMAGKAKASTLGVKAEGDDTLVVTLERAMPYFNTMLASPTFAPQSQAFVEKAGSKYGHSSKYILSNGPYILKDWNGTSDSWTSVKNPKYWNAKNVHIKTLQTKVVKDSATALNLYNTGKLDDASLSGQQAAQAKSNKDYSALKQSAVFYLEMNEKKDSFFKNTKIRQAISMILNRQQYISKVLNDGSIPATGVTPEGLAGDPDDTTKDFANEAAESTKQYTTYNKKEAEKLFAEGLKETGNSSISVSLLSDDTSAAKSTSQYLQSALQTLDGLKVSITTVPFKTRLTRSQNGQFDMVVSGWSADFPDPITFLDLFTSGNAYNDGKWSNAQYDKLIQESKTTYATDATKRWATLLKAQELLTSEAGVIPVYQQVASHLVNSKIKDLKFGPNGFYNYVGASIK